VVVPVRVNLSRDDAPIALLFRLRIGSACDSVGGSGKNTGVDTLVGCSSAYAVLGRGRGGPVRVARGSGGA
jgi:hypothetical protein